MVENCGVGFFKNSRIRTSPQPIAQGSAFVIHSMFHQKIAGEEIYVVNRPGRSLETFLNPIRSLKFDSHLTHSSQKCRVLSETSEERFCTQHRSFPEVMRSHQKAQLGIHQCFPWLRLLVEVRL